MSYPRFQMARNFKRIRYVGGDITFTSTTFVDLLSAANGDIVLAAQVGDTIEYSIVGSISASGAGDLVALDIGFVAAGAAANATPSNYFSGGLTDGVLRHQDSVAGTLRPANLSVMAVVQSADLTSGFVTLRLRGRGNNTNTKTVYADGTQRGLFIAAKNLGPVDPN